MAVAKVTTCKVVLGEMLKRQVVCGGPVVEAIDPAEDARCARCGAKYPKQHNYRKPKFHDAYSGEPLPSGNR